MNADISGNAGTATRLATARTISLTGAVTGGVAFDGAGNVSIAATASSDMKFSLAERLFFGHF